MKPSKRHCACPVDLGGYHVSPLCSVLVTVRHCEEPGLLFGRGARKRLMKKKTVSLSIETCSMAHRLSPRQTKVCYTVVQSCTDVCRAQQATKSTTRVASSTGRWWDDKAASLGGMVVAVVERLTSRHTDSSIVHLRAITKEKSEQICSNKVFAVEPTKPVTVRSASTA